MGQSTQFIKLSPLIRALQKHNESNSKFMLEHLLIHSAFDKKINIEN